MSKHFHTLIFITVLCMAMYACNGGASTVPVYTATRVDTPVTIAYNMVNTARGQEIFKQRCIACHGLYGNARNDNAANLQLSRIDSVSIVQTIANGRNNMPSFKGALADSDLSSLTVYVKSLRK